MRLPPPVKASDIMGNDLPGPDITVDESPIYLTGPDAEALLGMLSK